MLWQPTYPKIVKCSKKLTFLPCLLPTRGRWAQEMRSVVHLRTKMANIGVNLSVMETSTQAVQELEPTISCRPGSTVGMQSVPKMRECIGDLHK